MSEIRGVFWHVEDMEFTQACRRFLSKCMVSQTNRSQQMLAQDKKPSTLPRLFFFVCVEGDVSKTPLSPTGQGKHRQKRTSRHCLQKIRLDLKRKRRRKKKQERVNHQLVCKFVHSSDGDKYSSCGQTWRWRRRKLYAANLQKTISEEWPNQQDDQRGIEAATSWIPVGHQVHTGQAGLLDSIHFNTNRIYTVGFSYVDVSLSWSGRPSRPEIVAFLSEWPDSEQKYSCGSSLPCFYTLLVKFIADVGQKFPLAKEI